MQTAQSRRNYDHRIREAILESGDCELFPELEIPKSTIRSWVHRGLPDVVTSELVTCDRAEFSAESQARRQRAALLAGVVGLLAAPALMLFLGPCLPEFQKMPTRYTIESGVEHHFLFLFP